MEIVLKKTESKYLEIFSLLDLDNIHETFKRFSSNKEPLEANIFAVNEIISSHQLSKLKNHFDNINISSLCIYSNNRNTILTGKSLKIDSAFIKEQEIKKKLLLFNSKKIDDILHNGTVRSGERISSNGNLCIIGDVNHSRVARSNLWALSAFGADIILCGPKTLIPDEFINFLKTPAPNQIEDPVKSRGSITISRSLEESIKIADAIIVLRLQKERMMENLLSSIDSYSLDYGLTPEKLSLNNKKIPVLHPGPINRDIEISSKVVDLYPNCLINNQVANGIPIRMALLYLLQKNNK